MGVRFPRLVFGFGCKALDFRGDTFLLGFLRLLALATGLRAFFAVVLDLALFFFFGVMTGVYHPEAARIEHQAS